MERNSIIANLRIIAGKMVPIVEEAKIKPSHIHIPEEVGNAPTVLLQEGLEWLQKVFENEFAAIQQTKKLMPEEMWDHYKLMDMGETIEMRELNAGLRNLRRAIINKDRPVVFRKQKFSARKRTAATEGQDDKASAEGAARKAQ